MERLTSFRRSKYFLPTLLIIVALSIVTYAATTSISISNTSTIQAGQNIALTQPTTTVLTACPAGGSTSYTTTPTGLAWTLTAGGAAETYYFCEENVGSGSDVTGATVTGTGVSSGDCPASPTSATLSFNEEGSGTTIPPRGVTATPLTLNVCAGGAVSPGTGPTFTVTVT
jgi:hypothetical protein